MRSTRRAAAPPPPSGRSIAPVHSIGLSPGPLRGLAAVTVALALSCATTGSLEPEGPVVRSLDIEGTDALDDGDIKERILTTETPWWSFLPFVGTTHHFDPISWQADLRRVERFYEARGYYDARVVDHALEEVEDGVRLRIAVEEGAPTHVASIEVTGLESLPEAHREELLDDFPLEEGRRFEEEDWAGLKEELRKRLRELGYAEAVVEGEVEIELERQNARVLLQVTPGQRYRFGRVFVAAGPRARVSPQRIIEQVRGAISEDEWFSESALGEAQSRVFRMGVFGAVKVTRGAPDRREGVVPVVVDVREAPFHTLRYGLGLGIDDLRQEGRLLAEYTDRDFFGGLRTLSLLGRVGYGFFPSFAQVANPNPGEPTESGLVFDARAELTQPRFLLRDLSLSTALSIERSFEQASFSYLGGAGEVGVEWRPHPNVLLQTSFNLEAYRFFGQADLLGQNPELVFGCVGQSEPGAPCDVVLQYLEQTLAWDRRDDPVAPRRGFYLAVSFQEGFELPLGGGRSLGDFSYLRIEPEARGYVPLGDSVVLAARLGLGTLLPFSGESPLIARFFSGGSRMRGFNSRRLSPMLAIPRPELRPDGQALLNPGAGLPVGETLPVGGNGLVEATLEARFRVSENVLFATFVDAGLVSEGPLELTSPGYFDSNLQYAAGIGIRYETLVGPIRLDIATRLPSIGSPLPVAGGQGVDYPMERGCFGLFPTSSASYAGSPEGLCTFHLSIGEAF